MPAAAPGGNASDSACTSASDNSTSSAPRFSSIRSVRFVPGIATLGPGMEFGEMALLGHTTRSASIYADTEVRCRILEADDFGEIADDAPLLKITVLENLASDMANRLRGANQWIAALA